MDKIYNNSERDLHEQHTLIIYEAAVCDLLNRAILKSTVQSDVKVEMGSKENWFLCTSSVKAMDLHLHSCPHPA